MSCSILAKFEVNGQSFKAADIQQALEEDGARAYSHYPFTVLYELKDLIEPGWMMTKGGGKNAAKGQAAAHERRGDHGGGKGGGASSSANASGSAGAAPPPDPGKASEGNLDGTRCL